MIASLLATIPVDKRVAIILAGHNGSGKSSFWNDRLANHFQLPLLNADRLTLSFLPPDHPAPLRPWACDLRDNRTEWQAFSQACVKAFVDTAVSRRLPFAVETVFSYLVERGGVYHSKVEWIRKFQDSGYFVILIFVGLASPELSILRVSTRIAQGGHAVAEDKLLHRFPRTQKAIGMAANVADMTWMFDNSGDLNQAFRLARAQARDTVHYDCRHFSQNEDTSFVGIASSWLNQVVPL